MSKGQINKIVIVNGQSHESSHQFKVDIGLKSGPIEPMHLISLIEGEHAQIAIEDLFNNHCQVFFRHTTLINGRLSFEVNSHWQFERISVSHQFDVHYFLKGLIQDVAIACYLHVVIGDRF